MIKIVEQSIEKILKFPQNFATINLIFRVENTDYLCVCSLV